MTKFYLLPNTTPCQMFGAVVQTDNKTIVFDGGTLNDHPQMISFLREKANSRVDAWFFTHPHHDHLGTFVNVCRDAPEIEIDKIYCHFPDTETLTELAGREAVEVRMWHRFDELAAVRFADKIHRVAAGESFNFDEFSVSVLRTYNSEITYNFVNNSSAVYRIDGKEKSVLILGDLGVEGGREVMKNVPAEKLYADYTQMAHHGQAGVDEEFYNYIKVKSCIWASPDWLWDCDNGTGKGSGPWQTLETREWMEKLGVKEHIIEKDGITEIKL